MFLKGYFLARNFQNLLMCGAIFSIGSSERFRLIQATRKILMTRSVWVFFFLRSIKVASLQKLLFMTASHPGMFSEISHFYYLGLLANIYFIFFFLLIEND